MGVVRRRQLKEVITFQRAMTEKGRQIFKEKNRVTPSVAAPGDTNPSDATVRGAANKQLAPRRRKARAATVSSPAHMSV